MRTLSPLALYSQTNVTLCALQAIGSKYNRGTRAVYSLQFQSEVGFIIGYVHLSRAPPSLYDNVIYSPCTDDIF